MKLGINWNEPSTRRGAVWAITGVLMVGCIFTGKPEYIAYISAGATTVAGGLGLLVKDG
jgi:hypothetical protein